MSSDFLTPSPSVTKVRRDFGGVFRRCGVFSGQIMSTTGNNNGPDRLKDFGERLDQTLKARQRPKTSGSEEGSALSLAFRAITDLVVGIAVTTGVGWALDRYLGTSPWLMLVFMPLGFAAGIWNVMRLGRSKEAEELMDGKAPGEKTLPPSANDDEDDE